MPDLNETGMTTRRRVPGDAQVNEAEVIETPVQAPITVAAWGHVQTRDAMTLRERPMLTIARLAGLGDDAERALHLRPTRNTGAGDADGMAALLPVAIHVGVPRANLGFRLPENTFTAMASEGQP